VQEPVGRITRVPFDGPLRGLRTPLAALHGSVGRDLPVALHIGSDAGLPCTDAAYLLPVVARHTRLVQMGEETAAAAAPMDEATASVDDETCPSRRGEAGRLPGSPSRDAAVDDPVEELGEVLEVAELRDGAHVEGERVGVAPVHPERGGVEALAVGLAGAAHAAEVAREAERSDRVGSPRVGEEGGDGRCRGAGDDVEEEVEAGVPRGGERR
jgi:hypothetical protein